MNCTNSEHIYSRVLLNYSRDTQFSTSSMISKMGDNIMAYKKINNWECLLTRVMCCREQGNGVHLRSDECGRSARGYTGLQFRQPDRVQL